MILDLIFISEKDYNYFLEKLIDLNFNKIEASYDKEISKFKIHAEKEGSNENKTAANV